MLGSFIHREQYSLDLIPFDGDLLSMESESAFKVSARLVVKEKPCAWVLALSARYEGLAQQVQLGSECCTGSDLSLGSLTKHGRNNHDTSLYPPPPAIEHWCYFDKWSVHKA